MSNTLSHGYFYIGEACARAEQKLSFERSEKKGKESSRSRHYHNRLLSHIIVNNLQKKKKLEIYSVSESLCFK